MGSSMVGIAWRIVAKSDHVAAPSGVRSQNVIDLLTGEIAIATPNVFNRIGVDEGEKSGLACIAQ